MIVHECVQLSPEWWEARRGVPTASEFHRIITAKKAKYAEGARSYICKLVADTLRLDPPVLTEGPMTPAMRAGRDFEPEARRWYEFEFDCKVQQIGFVTTDDGRFGCSPDGLIPKLRRGLELKCVAPEVQVGYLLNRDDDGNLLVPDEYLAQVHGGLIVTGYDSWHFVSYCPGMPAQVAIEVKPSKWTDELRVCLERFWVDYQSVLQLLRPR